MKKRVLMISIGFTIFFLICTIISFSVEKLMIPEVTLLRGRPVEDSLTDSTIKNSCVTKNKDGIEGFWKVEERVNIWDEKEYVVTFSTDIVGRQGDVTIVTGLNDGYVVQDALLPLENGDIVKEAKR